MNNDSTTTLYLFSGNAETICAASGLTGSVQVVPMTEKQLMSVGTMVKTLRNTASKRIAFGAYSLDLQRYTGVVAVLLLLSGRFSGVFADEFGTILRLNPATTLLLVMPMLVIELAAGLFTVAALRIRLFFR